jgi:hypothetical protein
MGKGSGACSRQPLIIEAGVSQADSEVAFPPVSSEVDCLGSLNLNLKRIKESGRVKWLSADRQVAFYQKPGGWYVLAGNKDFQEVIDQAGLTRFNPPLFSSLKEARGAVSDAALDLGFNLSPKLKHPALSGYQIGDLPLEVYRLDAFSWQVQQRSGTQQLPEELAPYFANRKSAFYQALTKTYVLKTNYLTRQSAVLAVKEWLREYIQNIQ